MGVTAGQSEANRDLEAGSETVGGTLGAACCYIWKSWVGVSCVVPATDRYTRDGGG